MARQLLKQFILFLLALAASLFVLARNLVTRLLQSQLVKAQSNAGGLTAKPTFQRAAIVSTRGDSLALPFLLNLLDGLAENNFFVLVVATSSLPSAFRNVVLTRCHCLLERFSINPESAFKNGFDWIGEREELKEIETLAMATDGFYYPRRFASTIPQMLEQSPGWLSLFEIPRSGQLRNTFQLFRTAIFTSDAFRNYWQNFSLGAARLQAMARGERNLSGALLRAQFEPQAYYNAARLQADVLAALEHENIPDELHDVLNLTLGFERINRAARIPVRKNDALSLPAAVIAEKIGALSKCSDAAQAIGLLCNYLYQAPVRRDIASRGHYAATDIIDLAQGFSSEEKAAMRSDLPGKVTPPSGNVHQIPKRPMRVAGRSV